MTDDVADLLVIGGGINGCGIARDAAGRGLNVTLVEMGDLASATSSWSTKLFHGGLRYLEYFEFRLVRESLIERERLLRAMPHISWPMRFVLPYHHSQRFEGNTPTSRLLRWVMPWMDGRRPAWLIRLGLFLYDTLGGREILPGTKTLRLANTAEGAPLKPMYQHAYEYSDCWVDDARLVVLNARDAQARGADIRTRTKLVAAQVVDGLWHATVENIDTGESYTLRANMLVNAAGPWVADVLQTRLNHHTGENVRLVRGSHIVTRKLYDHDKCYFFQGQDGRICFAIPYETDFTLIGTTDADHADPDTRPTCSEAERDYLLAFVNTYLETPITQDDIVWSYAGVRPLYDDGASSATAATRDYVLSLETTGGAPALHVFGGKITTYRRLAEHALEKIATQLSVTPDGWTAGVALPGGAFPVESFGELVSVLERDFDFLDPIWAHRMARTYGTDAKAILGTAQSKQDLGHDFGASLTGTEVTWLMTHEFARRAEDVVWRRTKLGLRMTPAEIEDLDAWMIERRQTDLAAQTAA